MKKLTLLLTAALGFTFAANAQKQIDLGYYLIQPTGDQTTPFVLPCNDSFDVDLTIINHGPDSLVAGDSVLFAAPWSETGYVAVLVCDTTYLAGDTLVAGAFKQHVNDIERMYELNGGAATYKPFSNGDYFYAFLGAGARNGVEFTDPVDSNDEAAAIVTYNCGTSGIKELAKTTLNVYPNPTNGVLNFAYNFAKATTATVKVLDLMGRTVLVEQYDVNAGAKNFNLNVADLANGSYFIELTTSEEKGITKFTIAK